MFAVTRKENALRTDDRFVENRSHSCDGFEAGCPSLAEYCTALLMIPDSFPFSRDRSMPWMHLLFNVLHCISYLV